MADATLGQVVRHVRRLSSAGDLSDGELLRAFVSGQDQEAFAALARRHGPMVLNVCRRVLHHQEDAEDAFQATFLVLARKAASVRERAALASWLYGTAYRAALTLKRSAARRRAHEDRVRPVPTANPLNDLSWREVEALLEEEIQRLPEKYRMVFVLCCLESESRAEVARRLGLKEGTVSSRLDQARKRLQGRLARRGVTLSAVLGATAVARPAGAAVPLALLTVTARTAAAVAEGKTPAMSAQVASLGASAAWWKATAALALTLGVIAGWAGLIALHAPADDPRPDNDGVRRAAPAVRDDRHGDPLPPGAVSRLGTVRFRHGSTVTGLAFAPGGKKLVSASYDGTVRVWDSASGKELVRMSPNVDGSAYDLALSADGKAVATIGYDTLYLGELTTGRLARLEGARVEGRSCVALSPDGKLLAAQSAGDTVGLWATASRKLLRECRGHAGKVKRVTFAPDGKALASCAEDGTARIWDVESGKETLLLRRKGAVTAVAFSADGKRLATSDADGKVCCWALPGGKPLYETPSTFRGMTVLAFSPDGKTLAGTGDGNVLHLWHGDSGKPMRQLPTNPWAIAFSPDGTSPGGWTGLGRGATARPSWRWRSRATAPSPRRAATTASSRCGTPPAESFAG
jgi:RNA polymerase sigma factor (sigma-70 family)